MLASLPSPQQERHESACTEEGWRAAGLLLSAALPPLHHQQRCHLPAGGQKEGTRQKRKQWHIKGTQLSGDERCVMKMCTNLLPTDPGSVTPVSAPSTAPQYLTNQHSATPQLTVRHGQRQRRLPLPHPSAGAPL